MKKGWVSVHRKILGSPLWIQGTPTQKLLMIVLIMLASTDPREVIFDGKQMELCRGQLVTSIDSLVEILGKGASIQNVRTALANLKRFEFLTDKVTKRGRMINIVNYGVYQGPLRQPNRQTNKDLTTSNNINKENKTIIKKGVNRHVTKGYLERDYGKDEFKNQEESFFRKKM